MKGSIIRRGDRTYQLRLSLGYDEVTGKRIYKHKTVHCTRREAEKRLREMIDLFERGSLTVKEDRSSLNLLLEQWLQIGKRGEVSETTLELYARIVRIYIAPELGTVPLHRLSASHIRDFYMELTSKGIGVGIIRLVTTILRQSLDMAVSENRIAVNPVIGVKKPRRKREAKLKVVTSFTHEEAHRFIEAARKTRHYMMFKTALLSGMRPGEYLGMTLPNIKWDDEELQVSQAMIWLLGKDKGEFSMPKTEESRRLITMPAEFMTELREYVDKELPLRRQFAGEKWQENLLLFPNLSGGFQRKEYIRTVFKEILELAGLPSHFNPYTLRHTMATFLLGEGVGVKVVSERMGHSGPVITLRTYAHVLPSMQRGAAIKLGALFYPKSPEDDEPSHL